MEVSIVMPSHNRYPLNLLSLYALENQSFDLSKMEVILVDDASTDETARLKKYRPPYSFKYIRNDETLSIAATRNKGVKYAKGKIIIFLDAEMIVDPHYVRNRYHHHLDGDQTIVVGGKHSGRLYTCLTPPFITKQKNDLIHLFKSSSVAKKRIKKHIKKSSNQKVDLKDVKKLIKKIKQPLQLVNKKDIIHFQQLESFAVKRNKEDYAILDYLGDHTSPIGWWACLGNLSISKSFFDELGGFEEGFKGWGPEDVEFAYRLYKAGAKFVYEPSLIRYHQEHPKIKWQTKMEDKQNWLFLLEKHPELDVAIHSLNLIMEMDYAFVDHIMREHRTLKRKYPGKYRNFEDSLKGMLKEIRVLDMRGETVTNLLNRSSVATSTKKKNKIIKERNKLESNGNYMNLVKLFDLLTSI